MQSPTHGEVTADQMLAIIKKYIERDTDADYEIAVGCDSQSFKNKTKYVLVVTARRVGQGGIFFYEISWLENKRNLRAKIYQEVTQSLEIAQTINDFVISMDKENVVFSSVEVDIGKNGPTREFIKEIRGWIESTLEIPATIKGDGSMVIACAVANRISK